MGWGPIWRRAICVATVVLPALAPSAATAADPDLFGRLGLSALVDLRLALADGETDWAHGGTGKLRFGGDDGDWTPHAAIGDAHILLQPVAGAWRAHLDARLQTGAGRDFGLNEGWIGWRPEPGGPVRVSARAGIFYPPVSLEHDGPGWTTTRTITPSAINSWIGEEVKPAAGEIRVEAPLAGGSIAVTGALFGVNDTAGALLTFRGWALHDRTTVIGERQPLPPLSPFASGVQPRFTTPIYELDGRVGWYGQIEWKSAGGLAVNAFWYDNRGDRTSLDEDLQWSWQTRFLDIGARYDLDAKTQILAQFLTGRSEMGYAIGGKSWFDADVRSAYLLATRQLAAGAVTARVDWMQVSDRSLKALDDSDEHGWALTADYSRPLADWATVMIETIHVWSDRAGRVYAGGAPDAGQTQVQAALRCYF